MLEKWTQDQALILLVIGLAIIFVEVSALLSTFFACSKGTKRTKSQASTFTSTQTLSPFNESDHDFGNKFSFLINFFFFLRKRIIIDMAFIGLDIENRMHATGTTFGAKS